MRFLNTPDKIAEAGEQIYADRYKQELEAGHSGEFVAIDVLTGAAYTARFPEEALANARSAAPNGIFHLIRIGAPGAFKVSYRNHDQAGNWDGVLRQPR